MSEHERIQIQDKFNTLPNGLERKSFYNNRMGGKCICVEIGCLLYIHDITNLSCENACMHRGSREKENKYLSIKIIIKLFHFQKVKESQNLSVCE